MKLKLLILFLFASCFCFAQMVPLISAGSNWKYLDNGSNLGTAWQSPLFVDATWASGNSELGYGDSDEATVVGYGPSSSNKYITTYFRKTFNVVDPTLFFSLDLQAVRDDGIVVYINGAEVWRNNMPGGTISYTTLSSSTIAFGSESSWNTATISASYLVAGLNTIAVEIHQDAVNSSDISFNLKLNGNSTPTIATVDRGPYLNSGTPNSMIVKWRTTGSTDSKVYYGTSLAALTQVATNPIFTNNHEMLITGLTPSTIYYYTVGCSGDTLSGVSSTSYFKTSPPANQKGIYKFWAIGDGGMGDANQRNAKAGFMNYISTDHIDGWIWLGDNAYDNGYDSQYQSNVFTNNTYENELKRFVVWPAPGNHDYNNHIPFSPSPAYYDIFTLPTAAQAGGVASGTEKYYSYDYGNIHFIVLDSYDEGRNTTDPMALWLINDLAANTKQWTIAYWHHPPYTKGTHNSDNPTFIDGELVDIRENILPIIENAGVDLVLNGHSHTYERTFLMDGHYGYSSSFVPSMALDNGSGNYPTDCPYRKETSITASHKGTVYALCGCSSKVGSTSSGWPHPAMYKYSNTTLGSMLLEVNDNRLDAKFIDSTGNVYDAFTIVKNAGTTSTFNICPGDNITLKPSWPASVEWFPLGFTADSAVVNPLVSTVYYSYDAASCIQDTFIVNMLPPSSCTSTGFFENNINNIILVYPTILSSSNINMNIKFSSELKIEELFLYDVFGKQYPINRTENISDFIIGVSSSNISSGVYFLEIKLNGNQKVVKKIIVTD